MGTPAQKRSKQSKRERASHFAILERQLTTCPKCKKPSLPHHVCKFCGYYKGQDVLLIDAKSDRKKKKAKKKEDRAKNR